MKRFVLLGFLLLLTICSLFAGSRELTLSYTEKAYTNFDFLYGGSLLNEEGNNEKTVTLTDGKSKPIIVRWNYNIGPTALGSDVTGISINFTTQGFKHTADGVNDQVDVFFDIKVNDNNSNLYTSLDVSKPSDGANFGLLGIHPNTNIRGTADVAEITVTWDEGHSWIAGEYRCDILISFFAE